MYFLSSLLAFAALVAAQGPTIATPAAVVQCQPAQISYVATNTPVFISIIPGGQPSAAPLEDLGQKTSSPFTWVANIAAGTQITFQIRDSTGAVAYSAPVTIQTSSDSSCLGAGASASGSASSSASQVSASSSSVAGASSSSAAAVTSSVVESTSSVIASVSSAVASATAPATTSRASASSAASGSSTRSATATSAATSPSTTPNSARTNMQVGFAGLVGLVAAAVLA